MATATTRCLFGGIFLLGTALTACVSQSKYDTLQAQNAQLHQQLATNQDQLAAKQEQVARLQSAMKYTVESDLIFKSGSWEMSTEGKETLGSMALKLAPTQQNKLVINGYTDNTPIGPDLEKQGVTSNEVLSQKRADAVKEFLISKGVNPEMVQSVGHGEQNPIASNETETGRAKNRRVELSIGG